MAPIEATRRLGKRPATFVSIDHAANNSWRAQPAAACRPTHPVCCSLHCPPRGAGAHDTRWPRLAHPPAATEKTTATEERHTRNATTHAPRARASHPLLL